jgi:LCP family protein required for cell wall assembly
MPPKTAIRPVTDPDHRGDGAGGRRKRPKTKVRSPWWAKVIVFLGTLAMITGFGGIVVAKSFLGDLTSSIEVENLNEDGAAQAAPRGKPLAGAIDILLLGVDTRTGWSEGASRADTIMLLHVPTSHDQAYLMSIPRDSEVEIPSWSRAGFNGATNRINSAYMSGSGRGQGWKGGAGLMKKTVSQLTGLTFDGVIVIDFAGFKNVINAMGGVYLCVERDTWSSHYTKVDGKPVYTSGDPLRPRSNSWWHKKGCRDMAGWEALDYARQRHGLPNGDYDRQKHQQQLIKAMAGEATSAGIVTNPGKLKDLITAAGGSLKMDTGGYNPADFLFNLKALAGSDLMTLKTNSGTFNGTGDGAERLSPATMKMFAAAKEDRLGEFIMQNPEFLNSPV